MLHTASIRRKVLLLSVVTILSLIGILKLISYNNEQRTIGETELRQSYKVLQNIESIRTSIGETETLIQSYMLTGDKQWKNSLSSAYARMLKTLDETATLETDLMQQHKFSMIKQAIQQKIAFQQTIISADSITPEFTAAMGFHGLNKRLSQRIQTPLSLSNERQQLLLQRKTDTIESASIHAKFITIFSAVFVYMLILAALWHLRNQVQPGPAAKMGEENEQSFDHFDHNRAVSGRQSGFKGVFPITDGKDEKYRRQEGTGIVRVLWSKAELEENFGYLSTKMEQLEQLQTAAATAELLAEEAVPDWKVAGLPEELTLHFDQGNDHFLGHAVNANFYQSGPVYNRQTSTYPSGGPAMYRVLPSPGIPGTDMTWLPAQEQPGFDLHDLVKQVLQPFYAQADEKNIRLLHTIDPSIPGFLSGDAKKLRNILHSILENAMRFTFKGYIQLTITTMNLNGDQAEIAFSVADTGKGLDAEQLHDLLHGNGSKVPALYHAKKLAESQQSQLMIHSTEEDGTVCCFMGSYRV